MIGNVTQARRKQDKDRREVRVSIMVSKAANHELIDAVRRGTNPQTSSARLHIEAFDDNVSMRPSANALSDFAIVLVAGVPSAGSAAAMWRDFSSVGVPCVIVGKYETPYDAKVVQAALVADGVATKDLLLGLDVQDIMDNLGDWVMASVPDEMGNTCGLAFACCRDSRAKALVSQAIKDNALTSLWGLLPASGADRAVMTANQIALSFNIAQLYGEPLDVRRAREVLPIIIGSRVWRGLARSAIKHLPIPAIVVRGAIAAGGTAAVGTALLRSYQHTDIQTSAQDISDSSNAKDGGELDRRS